jgi:alkanesulfonate monooxygenase SsuD/methylene tetrahydromethanopterin reductase-like flavin-dependent oxidoreductase (luciferase family)
VPRDVVTAAGVRARRGEKGDTTVIAELNLNDIKGHRAPMADCWTLAPAVAAVTSTLELMLAGRCLRAAWPVHSPHPFRA